MVNKHLITGITGQDGIFLTSIILNNNPNDLVIGISRDQKNKEFFNKLKIISSEKVNSNNIKILNSNLENKNEVNSLIKKTSPDFIYNLTGPSSVYKSMLNNDDTYEKITIIFDNLINAVINNNSCNFFQASSSEMFDLSENPLDENSKFKTRSPYAEAKLHVHEYIQKIKSNYEINISSGIMFNHESEFRNDEYLIMKIIKNAILISKKKEDNLKIGSVDIIRDWSYAGDMADAIFKINNINNCEDYVIGSGKGNKIELILDIVFEHFNLDWKDFVTIDNSLLRKGDPKSIVSNPKKIYEDTGWKAQTSLEQIIKKCINFKKNNYS